MLEACARAGVLVELVPWDDPSVDWSQYKAAILRSCWNYYEDPEAFRHWILEAATKTQLVNPPETLLYNLDKRYLLDLQGKGIAIVPTRLIRKEQDLLSAVLESGWDRFVVKSMISAASFMTRHFNQAQVEEATTFVSTILESRTAMIQPFMASVADGGEVSLIHLGGELTHAIVKQPRFDGGEEDVSAAFQPDATLRETAAKVLSAVDFPWVYARVDLMRGDDGTWLLSELELLEPSLFLAHHPPALAKFAELVAGL